MKAQRFLVVYSGVLTVLFATTVLIAARPSQPKSFDEITVQRINVVEPDGTLRMVVSNHARLPGVYSHGKEQPAQDRPQAGMIFLNDEGSEIGGLIFGGKKTAKGDVVDSGGSLSFDRYGANQVVQLLGVDDSEDRMSGLSVTDSPAGNRGYRRIWLGRGGDNASTLTLADANGKKRLQLQVQADGTTQIVQFDAAGKKIRDLLAPTP
ncbi:MAG TPA: hypothetical protein VGE98_15680 [Thermoanaerobaculia bacterium]